MAARPSELTQAALALRPFFRTAALFSVLAGLMALVPSVYMLEVYGRVVSSRNLWTLVMLTVLVLGCYVVMEVLDWARLRTMQQAGVELDRRLGDRVFSAMFAAQLGPLGAARPGLGELRVLRDFLSAPPLLAVMEVPVAVVFLVLVFAMHPLLGAAALAGVVLQTFLGWLGDQTTRPALADSNRAALDAQQYAQAVVRNAQVIEGMGMQSAIHRLWMDRQRQALEQQVVASERAAAHVAAGRFIQMVLGSLLLGLGAWLLMRDALPLGPALLVVAAILGARVLAPLVTLITHWRAVVSAREAWRRLDEFLAAMPQRPPTMPLPAPTGNLQAEQVVATAPGSPVPILKGVSFVAQPGELLAVIGPCGSGKSSLARVIVGLWPCANGKVRLDKVDVFAWDKGELGPWVGYLPQDVELFDGTVAGNIARFGEADPARVEAAARAAGLHEFVLQLPQGYDTPLGLDGMCLSGGQRQRVGLARALFGDPVLVVLDEPNASLDDAGDAALASALVALKARGATVVVITQRGGVVALADKLLVLREGQVHAWGPRDDVLVALNAKAGLGRRPGAPTPGQPLAAAS